MEGGGEAIGIFSIVSANQGRLLLEPRDVYRLDLNARWLGVPTELLMENAGKNVAEEILQRFPESRKIVCVCSRTNNGGDGLVVARHLSLSKIVEVVFIGRPEQIRTRETRLNWEIIEGLDTVKKHMVKAREDLVLLEEILSDVDVVVDAIFGVGIRGKPRGLEAETIERINTLKRKYGFKIVSVDVPSGFDCFRGSPTEIMIDSDVVVTFHDMKKGLDRIGVEIVVKGIGIPRDAEIFVGPGDLLGILKTRDPWSHKGEYGKILIVGGSKYYTGAPALSALSALRTGADLAVIFAPSEVADTIRSYSPNLIVWSYEGEFFNKDALEPLLEIYRKFDVIVLGPGIGQEKETLSSIKEAIRTLDKPLVIDADALKALAKYGAPKKDIILTPHAGEFKMMFGVELPRDIFERAEIVKKMAQEHGVTILLKGHIDVISNGVNVKLNKTGNPGMTVGGTGDVLTGIIATIRAWKQTSMDSASVGAFICGLAGDIAYEKYGYELTATDVANNIPEALRKIRDFIRGS